MCNKPSKGSLCMELRSPILPGDPKSAGLGGNFRGMSRKESTKVSPAGPRLLLKETLVGLSVCPVR